ncbi:putative IS4 family transposase, partial [Rhizobium sp. PDO1-076]|uniref:IS701 family transposase n=1 Tax=Rhizobium sp. PDO1-076 TaxID=1125979 RepID=UPI00024E2983
SWTGTAIGWERELLALKAQLLSVFHRSEARETCSTFLDGLLSGTERKTGWQMAERAGFAKPWRTQALLGRSVWDADRMRDIVFNYVVASLGDASGVLVIDETGFVKKGDHSVGVSRQDTGTAGRIENCQIGVFIAYASRFGQALIDRRLYLPEAWATDEKRRKDAAIPQETVFATRPALARAMLSEALDKGVACAWVLADADYSSDCKTRRMLERRRQPYVLAVSPNQKLRLQTERVLLHASPQDLAEDLPADLWFALPSGEGPRGLRLYDWARVSLSCAAAPGFARYLLLRRCRSHSGAVSQYLVFAPAEAALADLAGAAGLRWTIDECFQRAKNELGLDHCEARSWHGWHRHMTLVMAAAAFLTKLSADLRRSAFGKTREKRSTSSIAA